MLPQVLTLPRPVTSLWWPPLRPSLPTSVFPLGVAGRPSKSSGPGLCPCPSSPPGEVPRSSPHVGQVLPEGLEEGGGGGARRVPTAPPDCPRPTRTPGADADPGAAWRGHRGLQGPPWGRDRAIRVRSGRAQAGEAAPSPCGLTGFRAWACAERLPEGRCPGWGGPH